MRQPQANSRRHANRSNWRTSAGPVIVRSLLVALTMLVSGCAGVWTRPAVSERTACLGWSEADYTAHDLEVISDQLAIWLEQHETYGDKHHCH